MNVWNRLPFLFKYSFLTLWWQCVFQSFKICSVNSPQQVSVAPFCAAQASVHCLPLSWGEVAWMACLCLTYRFPHAAQHGPVWIQRPNGLPPQARCDASQWQEVWPFLWQDWHRCGEHTDHQGRFTTLLLQSVSFFNHQCGLLLSVEAECQSNWFSSSIVSSFLHHFWHFTAEKLTKN